MATRRKKDTAAVSEEAVARIRASLAEWEAGKWAEQVAYGPQCLCGLREGLRCERHPGKSAERDSESGVQAVRPTRVVRVTEEWSDRLGSEGG